jgi:Tfp pilus assembly protein PilN
VQFSTIALVVVVVVAIVDVVVDSVGCARPIDKTNAKTTIMKTKLNRLIRQQNEKHRKKKKKKKKSQSKKQTMSIRDEDRKGMDMTGVVDYGAKLDLYEWTQTRTEVTCTSTKDAQKSIDQNMNRLILIYLIYLFYSSKRKLARRRVGLCRASAESAKSRNSHDVD